MKTEEIHFSLLGNCKFSLRIVVGLDFIRLKFSPKKFRLTGIKFILPKIPR